MASLVLAAAGLDMAASLAFSAASISGGAGRQIQLAADLPGFRGRGEGVGRGNATLTVVAQAKEGKGGKGKKKGAGKKGSGADVAAAVAPTVDDSRPPYTDASVIMHSLAVIDSYYRATGQHMFDHAVEVVDAAKELWHAPFALMSTGDEPNPNYSYGNEKALYLFECPSFSRFTSLPAIHCTSDPTQLAIRAKLLLAADTAPVNLKGIQRESISGRKFEVEEGVLWTLMDLDGDKFGQAEVIRKWHFLDEEAASDAPPAVSVATSAADAHPTPASSAADVAAPGEAAASQG